MTPESIVKKSLVRYLKGLRRTHVFVIQDKFTAGVPDIIAVHDGRFVAVEVKAAKGTVSVIQALTLAAIRACGGIAGVACCVDDLKILLKERRKNVQ